MATKTITMSSPHFFDHVCKEIHNSWGHPKDLVHALANLTQPERQKIREKYREIYGEDFMDRLQNTQMVSQRNEVSAKMFAALSMLMLNPHDRDAAMAREALEQSEVNYNTLTEIFVCRKSSHVLLILQAYQSRFKRNLEHDIVNIEPLSPYQKILMALAASHKAHNAEVSKDIAKCDARRLYQTGEGNPGPIDEAVVLEILSKRSIAQLKLTFTCYKHIYGHSYTKSLNNENYGEFEDALKVIVKCIHKPTRYYAKTLCASIKGTTTDKSAMERVMVSRADVDMDEIQTVFKKKYGMQLRDGIIENIPSGDYRDFLVALATKKCVVP